ncbi:MAG: hypothetical protein ABSB24_03900 [Gaiellaceae bacterium]|jgi:hypothetical protein
MVAFLAALALAPWAHPLSFRPLLGWQTGMSGTHSAYVKTVLESSAWIARNVRYRDDATADPPNKTLKRLPRDGVIVWAVIDNPAQHGAKPIRLDLGKAKRCGQVRAPVRSHRRRRCNVGCRVRARCRLDELPAARDGAGSLLQGVDERAARCSRVNSARAS